jgi:dephospho-CoA kinase
MKKLKIAVTGNIGSGKSSFCKFLEEMNYTIINADEIAKDLMTNDPNIKVQIIKQFGNSAYTKEGLNRTYLAEKIFSNEDNLLRMNLIVHPAVVNKVEQLMNELLKKADIVFHEAALIYEADIEELFDIVVLITADYNIRLKRKQQSDNYSEEEFAKRNSNQIPDDEKVKRADFVFENNGTLDELKIKADLMIRVLTGMIQN